MTTTMLRAPDEVWVRLQCLLFPDAVLLRVCRRLRALLRGVALRCGAADHHAATVRAWLAAYAADLRVAAVHSDRRDDAGLGYALAAAAGLRSLGVTGAATGAVCRALAAAPPLARLHHLTLDWRDPVAAGVTEVRTLAGMRGLRAVELNLRRRRVGAAWVRALVETVGALPELQVLRLDCVAATLGDGAVSALAGLGPRRELVLDVTGACLHGAARLRVTGLDPGGLRTLRLSVWGARRDDADVVALVPDLRRLTGLTSLALDAGGNRLSAGGVGALVRAAAFRPALRTLVLGVQGVPLCPASLAAWDALRTCPALTACSLYCGYCAADDAAVGTLLAVLRALPALARLVLDLRGNPLTLDGARAVAAFCAGAPPLRAAAVHLSAAGLSNADAVEAAFAPATARLAENLRLDLGVRCYAPP